MCRSCVGKGTNDGTAVREQAEAMFLAGENNFTNIAKVVGVTRERVRQIINRSESRQVRDLFLIKQQMLHHGENFCTRCGRTRDQVGKQRIIRGLCNACRVHDKQGKKRQKLLLPPNCADCGSEFANPVRPYQGRRCPGDLCYKCWIKTPKGRAIQGNYRQRNWDKIKENGRVYQKKYYLTKIKPYSRTEEARRKRREYYHQNKEEYLRRTRKSYLKRKVTLQQKALEQSQKIIEEAKKEGKL